MASVAGPSKRSRIEFVAVTAIDEHTPAAGQGVHCRVHRVFPVQHTGSGATAAAMKRVEVLDVQPHITQPIECELHGVWALLAAIEKDQVLELTGMTVVPNPAREDALDHAHRLLFDESERSEAAQIRVRRGAAAGQLYTLSSLRGLPPAQAPPTAASASSAFSSASAALAASGGDDDVEAASDATGAAASSARGKRKRVAAAPASASASGSGSGERTGSSTVVYTPLGEVRNGDANVYCVVRRFVPPKQAARGAQDWHLTVNVRDASLAPTADVVLNIFRRSEAELPHIARQGDVLRLHRVAFSVYRDKLTGTVGANYRGFGALAFDGTPGASLEPYWQSSREYSTVDPDAVRALRDWAQNIPVQTVRSAADTRRLDQLKTAVGYCDLLAQVIAVDEKEPTVFVWDGTTTGLRTDRDTIAAGAPLAVPFAGVREAPRFGSIVPIRVAVNEQTNPFFSYAKPGQWAQFRNVHCDVRVGFGVGGASVGSTAPVLSLVFRDSSKFTPTDTRDESVSRLLAAYDAAFAGERQRATNAQTWSRAVCVARTVHTAVPEYCPVKAMLNAPNSVGKYRLRVRATNYFPRDVQRLTRLFCMGCRSPLEYADRRALLAPSKAAPHRSCSLSHYCAVRSVTPATATTPAVCTGCAARRAATASASAWASASAAAGGSGAGGVAGAVAELRWVYLFRLCLSDATGSVSVTVTEADADHFFPGLPACDLSASSATRAIVQRKLQALIAPDSWLDATVCSYAVRMDALSSAARVAHSADPVRNGPASAQSATATAAGGAGADADADPDAEAVSAVGVSPLASISGDLPAAAVGGSRKRKKTSKRKKTRARELAAAAAAESSVRVFRLFDTHLTI